MPVPETKLLPRKNITEALSKAVGSHQLVVLTAPMGYGKTTVARELMLTMGYRSYIITINPGPHNAYYLWYRSCAQLAVQGSEIAPGLQARGFPVTPGELQRALDLARKHIDGRPTLIILDDYHYVTAPAMNHLLENIVREEIPGLSHLVFSRSKPGIPLEDLVLKGLASVFNKDLLAFSQQDARDFFHMHHVKEPGIADKAWKYSEGWPAALWLSLQSYQTHGALAPDRNVESLLDSVVFSRYTDEEKRFLLHLSLLNRFSPGLAAAATGDPSAPRKLQTLHEKNAFLNYDPGTDTYSLHTLFRNYLVKLLKSGENAHGASINAVDVNRRLGEWHEAEHDYLQAVKAYAAAGTDDAYLSILKIFEKPSDGLLVMYDPVAIKKVFTTIPWKVRFLCPLGYLAYIYHFLSRVSLAEALPLLDEAEQCFANEPSIPENIKRRIKGEIILIRGIKAFNNLFEMRDTHEAAHILLDGRSSISHRQLIWNFGCPHAAFLYLREPGTFQQLVELVEKNLHYFQAMADGCSMGAQDLFRAELLLERGRMKQVETSIMKAVYRASGKEQCSTIIAANFALSRLLLATGQHAKALSVQEDMLTLYGGSISPLLANALDSGRGYIFACLGNYEQIPRWLREGKVAVGNGFYQGAAFPRVVFGKSLLIKKDWLRLETYAQDLPSMLGGYSLLFVTIHAKVMEAIAAYHLDGVASGAAILNEALQLAEPDTIILTIAEYGKSVIPLLRHQLMTNPDSVFAKDILKLAQRYKPLSLQQDGENDELPLSLKEREKLLLNLAAQGKSNNEIAAHLKISEAAVKKSFSAIYRKLGVNRRMQAIQLFLSLNRK